MKVGDLINIPTFKNKPDYFPDAAGIVIKIWEFGEYCRELDDGELEYDIDEAWEHWQKSGPLVDVLGPEQDIIKIWSGGPRV